MKSNGGVFRGPSPREKGKEEGAEEKLKPPSHQGLVGFYENSKILKHMFFEVSWGYFDGRGLLKMHQGIDPDEN